MAKNSTDARAELKQLNAQIEERKKYYKEQEKAIDDMVEAGNSELMSLNHEVEVAKKQLRDIKTDIRTSAQDKKLLNEDLEAMRNEANSLAPGMVNAFA